MNNIIAMKNFMRTDEYKSLILAAESNAASLLREINRYREALELIAQSECPQSCKSCEKECDACIAKVALRGME